MKLTIDDFQEIGWEDTVENRPYVYILHHTKDGGVYIGVSGSPERFNAHRRDLLGNRSNKNLQAAFDKYGRNFDDITIHIFYTDDHYRTEMWLLDNLENTYNIVGRKTPLGYLSPTRLTSLYDKLEKDDCWIWTAHIGKDGYGRIMNNKKSIAAHRVFYTLAQRDKLQDPDWEIPDNLLLRHQCHNKACCNPLHLLTGTDKENMADSKDQPRKSPIGGRELTAWGETKKSSEWMKDKRKHPDIGFSTFNARIKKLDWSVEDALTKPPFKREVDEEKRKKRKDKRIQHEQKRTQQFRIASLIRYLYKEGEHIDDLVKHFQLQKTQIRRIINKKQWYNPSVTHKDLQDYVCKKRRLPPENVVTNDVGLFVDDVYGIQWKDGYFTGYAYFSHGRSINCGKHENVTQAARALNEIYVANGELPPYEVG